MSLVLIALLCFTDTHEEDMHLLPLSLTGHSTAPLSLNGTMYPMKYLVTSGLNDNGLRAFFFIQSHGLPFIKFPFNLKGILIILLCNEI